ncbi:hypothetical protein [Actinoplanes sp. M2I2]|uniref:hypothetical protein n=1 Tax=Actinoplanes sp. M2I2 TaxID=1734444 RepID=UPI002020BC0A|nr:hypothetical protein [Actinoplanes sp. M2I2]
MNSTMRYLVMVGAGLAAFPLATPAQAAEPATQAAHAHAEVRTAGYYKVRANCVQAGHNGVADGRWASFECRLLALGDGNMYYELRVQ